MLLTRKLLVVIILFAPLLLFGERQALLLIFDILCLLSGALSLSSAQRRSLPLNYRVLGTFFMVVAFLGFQATPLPPSWINVLSPATWAAYQDTIWLVRPGQWMPLSIQPYSTFQAIVHIVALSGLCLSIGHEILRPHGLRRAILVMAVAISFWALLGAAFSLLHWSIPTLASDTMDELQRLRHQLQIYGLLLLPMLWGGFTVMKARVVGLTLAEQFRLFLRSPKNVPHFSIILATILLFCSLGPTKLVVLAAVVIGAGWLIYLTLISMLMAGTKPVHLMIGLLVSAYLAGLMLVATQIFAVTAEPAFSGQSVASAIRPSWGATWFGSGVGAQQDIYQPFVSAGLFGNHALLALWLGLGVIGTVLVAIFILELCLSCGAKKNLLRTNRLQRNFFAGGLTSIAVILLCGTDSVDPGWYGLIYLLLLAATTIAYVIHAEAGNRAMPAHSVQHNQWATRTGLLVMLLLCGADLLLHCWPVTLSMLLKPGPHNQLNAETSQTDQEWVDDYETTYARLSFDSISAAHVAQVWLRLHRDDKALHYFTQAFQRRPLHTSTRMNLAAATALNGQGDVTMRLLSSPSTWHFHPDQFTEQIVLRLLNREDKTIALQFIKQIFRLAPAESRRFAALLSISDLSMSEIMRTIPDDPKAWFEFGNYLLYKGDSLGAEQAFDKAFGLCRDVFCHDASILVGITEFYVERRRYTEAKRVATAGSRLFPEHRHLKRLQTGLHSNVQGSDTPQSTLP